MLTEAIPTPATEHSADEPKQTLSLIRVKVEETMSEAADMMPKFPCGGILMSD